MIAVTAGESSNCDRPSSLAATPARRSAAAHAVISEFDRTSTAMVASGRRACRSATIAATVAATASVVGAAARIARTHPGRSCTRSAARCSTNVHPSSARSNGLRSTFSGACKPASVKTRPDCGYPVSSPVPLTNREMSPKTSFTKSRMTGLDRKLVFSGTSSSRPLREPTCASNSGVPPRHA